MLGNAIAMSLLKRKYSRATYFSQLLYDVLHNFYTHQNLGETCIIISDNDLSLRESWPEGPRIRSRRT